MRCAHPPTGVKPRHAFDMSAVVDACERAVSGHTSQSSAFGYLAKLAATPKVLMRAIRRAARHTDGCGGLATWWSDLGSTEPLFGWDELLTLSQEEVSRLFQHQKTSSDEGAQEAFLKRHLWPSLREAGWKWADDWLSASRGSFLRGQYFNTLTQVVQAMIQASEEGRIGKWVPDDVVERFQAEEGPIKLAWWLAGLEGDQSAAKAAVTKPEAEHQPALSTVLSEPVDELNLKVAVARAAAGRHSRQLQLVPSSSATRSGSNGSSGRRQTPKAAPVSSGDDAITVNSNSKPSSGSSAKRTRCSATCNDDDGDEEEEGEEPESDADSAVSTAAASRSPKKAVLRKKRRLERRRTEGQKLDERHTDPRVEGQQRVGGGDGDMEVEVVSYDDCSSGSEWGSGMRVVQRVPSRGKSSGGRRHRG